MSIRKQLAPKGDAKFSGFTVLRHGVYAGETILPNGHDSYTCQEWTQAYGFKNSPGNRRIAAGLGLADRLTGWPPTANLSVTSLSSLSLLHADPPGAKHLGYSRGAGGAGPAARTGGGR